MSTRDAAKAHIVGGGIASLAAAVLLIRDGGFRGNIRIVEELDIAGGALDIPNGAKNYALLGQYVEIPEDVVFTVEYSVRAAMHGVYGLLGLKNEIPPIYHGIADPKAAMAGLRTLMG